jgi:hypothetical protein
MLKSYNINDLPSSPSVDKVGVEERVARFQSRSIKNQAKMQGLKMVLSMIDLTTLEGKDTPGKVGKCVLRQPTFTMHTLIYLTLLQFVYTRQWLILQSL